MMEAGTKLTVTWGPEKFSPVQYQTFDVGPFSTSVTIGAGETGEEAHARAMTWLRKLAVEQFKVQLGDWLARVKDAAAQARAR